MAEDTKKVSKAKLIQVLSALLDFKANEDDDSSSLTNLLTKKVLTQPENITPPMCPMSRVMNLASHCTRSQRWTAAAKFFPAVARHISANPLSVWKIGAACLAYHGNSNRALMGNFANAMIRAGRFASPEILLDHVIYLMCNGEYEEASRFIDNYKKKCPKSYSETLWATLQGTRGLLEYISWRENLQINENSDDADPLEAISREAKIANHAEKSIDCFKNSLSCSSNFDVFIVKLIEVLEFYERLEEADQALASYIQLNYRQPTPYIFMLNFIQKHYPDDVQRQIYILKELVKICPCDSHVLKLVKLLPVEEMQCKMNLLFNFVDYDEWRNEIDVWKCLTEVVLYKPKNLLAHHLILRKMFDERISWWSLYHFVVNELDFSDLKLRELAIHKAIIATIMYNSAHHFVKSVSNKLSEEGDEENLKKLSDMLVTARQVGEAIKMSLLEAETLTSSSVSNVYCAGDKPSLPVLCKPKNTLLPRSNAKNVTTKPNILRTYERSSVSSRPSEPLTMSATGTTTGSFLQELLKNSVTSSTYRNNNLANVPLLTEINTLPVRYATLNGQAGAQQPTPFTPSVSAMPIFLNKQTPINAVSAFQFKLQNLMQNNSKCNSSESIKPKFLEKNSGTKKNSTLPGSGKKTQKRKINSTLPISNKKSVNGSQINLNTPTSDTTIVKIENSKIPPFSVCYVGDLSKTMKTAKIVLKRLTETEIEKYKPPIKEELINEIITLD